MSATKPPTTPTKHGAPARPTSLLKQLRELRRARDEDERVRLTLGLRYIGLTYGPFNSDPKELYVDSSGFKVIRVKLGVYRRI